MRPAPLQGHPGLSEGKRILLPISHSRPGVPDISGEEQLWLLSDHEPPPIRGCNGNGGVGVGASGLGGVIRCPKEASL